MAMMSVKKIFLSRIGVSVSAGFIATASTLAFVQPAAAASEADIQETDALVAAERDATIEESIPEDSSPPTLRRNEVIADFLGKNYDQRAVIESDQSNAYFLRIYDHPSRGGALLSETQTDLSPGLDEKRWSANYKNFAHNNGVSGLQLAGDAKELYISGLTGPDQARTPKVYKVDPRSGCAAESCGATTILQHSSDKWRAEDRRDGIVLAGWEYRLPQITALAFGVVKGENGDERILAAGHSVAYFWEKNKDWLHFGDSWETQREALVDFVDTDTGTIKHRQWLGSWTDKQTVSSLGIGEIGGGKFGVAIGLASENLQRVQVRNLSSGTYDQIWSDWSSSSSPEGRDGFEAPTSFAFGKWGSEDSLAIGHNNGRAMLVKPQGNLGTGAPIAETPAGGGAVEAINYLPVLTKDGKPKLLTGQWRNQTHSVLSQENGKLSPMALGREDKITNKPPMAMDDKKAYQWYPGRHTLKFAVDNTSAESVQVAVKSDVNEDKGCWSGGTTQEIQPGVQGEAFSSDVMTSSDKGWCGDADARYAYVVLNPTGNPGARTIARIEQSNGAVTVKEQVGDKGLRLKTERLEAGYKLVIEGASPQAAAAPQVTGQRLVSKAAEDKGKSVVYRFDVSGAEWIVPDSGSRTQAVLPALTVEGSTNGITWSHQLGKLMPASEPVRDGDKITLGPASFFWESQETNGVKLSKIRVSNGLKSTPIIISDLDNAAPEAVSSTVKPSFFHHFSTPSIAPNGLDQAPVDVVIKDGTASALEPSHPFYSLLYFRETSGKLITGLYQEGKLSNYISVESNKGSYSNTELAALESRYRVYLSTTSTTTAFLVNGYLEDGSVSHSGQFNFYTNTSAPSITGSPQIGLQAGPCPIEEGVCQLANPEADGKTHPALFQAGLDARNGTGPAIGLMWASRVAHAVESLPLPYDRKALIQTPMRIEGKTAYLDSGFNGSLFNAALITHGRYIDGPRS